VRLCVRSRQNRTALRRAAVRAVLRTPRPDRTWGTAYARDLAGSPPPSPKPEPFMALLQLGKGVNAPRISNVVPLTPQAIRKVGHRYREGGLEPSLYEKQRPGAATLLDDSQKQRIIAMVCSDPPEGRARWTVRLVAQEAVKRRLVPRVGRETVRILLLRSIW
jgi:transposase